MTRAQLHAEISRAYDGVADAVKGSKGILPGGARLRADQMPVTLDMGLLQAVIDELDPEWDSAAPWLVYLRTSYTEALGRQRSREIPGLYARAIRDALAPTATPVKTAAGKEG